MTKANSARAEFNNAAAAGVARSVDPGLSAERSPSARFACFGDDKRLLQREWFVRSGKHGILDEIADEPAGRISGAGLSA